jgi:hypothetical protein
MFLEQLMNDKPKPSEVQRRHRGNNSGLVGPFAAVIHILTTSILDSNLNLFYVGVLNRGKSAHQK